MGFKIKEERGSPSLKKELPFAPIAVWQQAGQFAGFFGDDGVGGKELRQAHLRDIMAQLEDHISYGNVDLEIDLAVTQHLLGQTGPATEKLEKAEDRTDAAHYQLGRVLFDRLDSQDQSLTSDISWTTVADNLRKALRFDQANVPAYFYLGQAILNLIREESLKGVEELFTAYLDSGRSLRFEPQARQFLISQDETQRMNAAFEKGKQDLEAGDLDSSIAALEEAISLGHQESFYYLGKAFGKQSNFFRAVDAFQRAREAEVKVADLEEQMGLAIFGLIGDRTLIQRGLSALKPSLPKDQKEINQNRLAYDFLGRVLESLSVFQVGDKRVHAVAFLSDRSFLTAASDGKLVKWDLHGNKLYSVSAHDGPVNQVAVTEDKRYILTGGNDGKARLWDLEGKNLVDYEGHQGPITALAFSPDGKRVITGSKDGTMRLWEKEGKHLFTFQADPEHAFTDIVYHPAGQHIITVGGADKKIRIWYWDERQHGQKTSLEGHDDLITSVAVSRDGKYILTGSRDKTVRRWRFGSDAELLQTIPHEGPVSDVAFSDDHHIIWSNDGKIRGWDFRGTPLASYGEEKSAFTSFSAYGDKIIGVLGSSATQILDVSIKKI